jgi:hypothetical protein
MMTTREVSALRPGALLFISKTRSHIILIGNDPQELAQRFSIDP